MARLPLGAGRLLPLFHGGPDAHRCDDAEPPANDADVTQEQQVTKNYGSVQALKGISLTVESGEVVALVGNPEVLFLDEPTTGLDVESRLAFWEQITHQAAQGKTIILTTHNLEEADALARRIVLINLGHVIADGTPEQIKGHVAGKRISFYAPHTTIEELNALVGAQAFQQRGNKFEMLTKDPNAVLATLSRHGVELSDLEVGSPSGDGQVWTHGLILLAYAVGFAVLAGWAYIRDENKNFA